MFSPPPPPENCFIWTHVYTEMADDDERCGGGDTPSGARAWCGYWVFVSLCVCIRVSRNFREMRFKLDAEDLCQKKCVGNSICARIYFAHVLFLKINVCVENRGQQFLEFAYC